MTGNLAAGAPRGHVLRTGGACDEHFLQFGNDVLPVRVALQGIDVRLHFLDHQFFLRWLRHIQHFLNHVIRILILFRLKNRNETPLFLTESN